MKQFLKSEKVTVLPNRPFSPDLASCDFFQNLRSSYLVDRWYMSRQALSLAEFVSLKLGIVLNQFGKQLFVSQTGFEPV